MKYMLLIYGNEKEWAEESSDLTPWMEYTHAVQEAGVYMAGAGLHPTPTATTVRKRSGATMTSDGPFAETKEQLGGYYLLDCPDLDDAIAWASKIPTVGTGSVEVRPVFEPPQA